MTGAVIAYNPCLKCTNKIMCEMCELKLHRDGVTVQKWIPVSERLPAPASKRNRYNGKCWTSETVLCVCVQNGGKRMVKEGRCEFYGDTPVWRIPGTIDSVTHWMPLPVPPKEET